MLVNAQVRVYYPPSPWHEKGTPLKQVVSWSPSFMLLGHSHSTWAHRVPGLWMEPRVSGLAHLSPLPGELAPSGGQCEEARVHFQAKTW